MKKFLTLLLLSPLAFAETYMCDDEFGPFAFKRTEYGSDLVQFTYQRNDESPLLYSIVRENNDHIFLMRDKADGSASFHIIGKKDNSFVGVYLKPEGSSPVFNGKCFELK